MPPTQRQLEILCLYAQGMGRRRIADELFLSPNTVRRHNTELREKLGTVTIAHTIVVALARGYLSVDSEAECVKAIDGGPRTPSQKLTAV